MELSTAPQGAGAGGQTEPAGATPLAIEGLSKSFDGRLVLDQVDLAVGPGEIVAVLGANGSGKSTSLRCVIGLARPDRGSIRINGSEVVGVRGAELVEARRQAAMIFQRIHLVHRRRALDNVCCGALGRLSLRESLSPLLFPDELREEAMSCLARVGLADRADDRATNLSGGQQQRVAIARALCQRAKVILADEPVAALDPAAAVQVMALLRDLAHDEGLGVAVVLHQPVLARRYADRIVGLLRGRVAFARPPAEIEDADIDALYADERVL